VSLQFADPTSFADQVYRVHAWDGGQWQQAFDLAPTTSGICSDQVQNNFTVPVTCAWSVTEERILAKYSFDRSATPDLAGITVGSSCRINCVRNSCSVLMANGRLSSSMPNATFQRRS
jgi:hypothetical protein